MSAIDNEETFSIAIIGAGFSGSMACVRLLEAAREPISIVLIEKADRFAKGAAYGTLCARHLLNVPAGGMSAYAEEPDHFFNWMKSRDASVQPSTFARRIDYGEYLEAQLNDALKRESLATVKKLRAEVVSASLEPKRDLVCLHLKDGGKIKARKVILTAGNFAPMHPHVQDNSFYDSPLYIANPWLNTTVGDDRALLIIGTGLTMVDNVLELRERGFKGTIHATSRHGLLPEGHMYNSEPLPVPLKPEQVPTTARAALAFLRRAYEEPAKIWQKPSVNWRQVIDSIRPLTQIIWQTWTLAEKRRFQRHLRHYWDVLRHRIAPEISQFINREIASGGLVIHPGRIQGCTVSGDMVKVAIRLHGSTAVRELEVQKVINCTGPSCNYQYIDDGLIKSLRDAGLLKADPCHIGIEVGVNKGLIDAEGKPSTCLFTLGPPLKGLLWESIAVPELRVQAKEIAKEVLSSLKTSLEQNSVEPTYS